MSCQLSFSMLLFKKETLLDFNIFNYNLHFFVGALRFMRKIIGLKEEFYNRYIVNGCLFQPVVEAFRQNGNRYNLLNSAMIELFEFIKTVSLSINNIYL